MPNVSSLLLLELVSRLVLPDEFPTRSLNPYDDNAEVMPRSAGGEKNSKKWRFLFKMPNIPKIRIKVGSFVFGNCL